ncbi:MAG: glutathione S-transferase family protein [Alphaproteobacteria bacterium]|nr:glutathione S-transferase family protein [Alphaproteobacteria bacterium]
MLTLYDNLGSGNGYKVRLLLTHLGIPFRRVDKSVTNGETRLPEYLRVNPNGRIPAVVFDDGRTLAESNAILLYFAEGTLYLPTHKFARAEVNQWLFFEQYSHEPYIAVLRFWRQYLESLTAIQEARVSELLEKGHAALKLMDDHMEKRQFLVDERYSIADIALYAYTHVAGDGGFDLAPYANLRAWLARVQCVPGHIPIDRECGP